MELDYHLIGQRIAHRRKHLKLTQMQVAERADISEQYLSNIERAVSIPSIRGCHAPGRRFGYHAGYLSGRFRPAGDRRWESVAQYLRLLDEKQLDTAESFLAWLSEQG